MADERCPLANKHGEVICRDGRLWALTYSEMGPPGSRCCVGECDWPGHKRAVLAQPAPEAPR